jgi:hypothetical protein
MPDNPLQQADTITQLIIGGLAALEELNIIPKLSKADYIELQFLFEKVAANFNEHIDTLD